MSEQQHGYSGWLQTLPQNPQQKDWVQLRNKLKSYVNSTKFLRQGSTVKVVDDHTGKLVNRPIKDVVYTQGPDHKVGIASQDMQQALKQAIVNDDRAMLRNLAKYNYTAYQHVRSPQDIQRDKDKAKRKRVLLKSLVFGGAGAALGLIPFMSSAYADADAYRKIGDAAILSGTGILGGISLTGITEAFRKDEA